MAADFVGRHMPLVADPKRMEISKTVEDDSEENRTSGRRCVEIKRGVRSGGSARRLVETQQSCPQKGVGLGEAGDNLCEEKDGWSAMVR
jgi:hypothetical protein